MAKNGDKISNNDTIEAEMESDDSEEDSAEDDDVEEAEILNLQEKVKENPYNYDSHLEFIKLLKKAGDLEKLREARQTMSEVFPLTPELWLDWLADEIRLEESRPRVYQLFDRAVQDYMSVSLWLEYIQYSIGDIGTEEGLQKIRGIAERALTAVGKNVAEGSLIWGAYREIETAVLAGLQPEPGRVASESLLERQEEQMKRMHSLFRRQLSVPLLHMETTWSEYKDWSDDNVEPQAQQAYEKATRQLQVLLPFEEELASAEGNKLEAYKSYLTREARENEDPARVQALFERAVVDNCLVPDLWLRYGKYVDKVLRARDVVLAVHKRAVRNCPWHVTLWLRYCRALERQCPDEHERIVEVFKRALFSDNFNQSNDFLQMWTGFIDYMRRRVHFESEHAKELEELRSTFQSAVDFLHSNYGNDGDPNCSIQQYWARIEAKFCSNMARARDLWSGVMQQGFGNQAQMWLEYINLERAYGDHKHCRKVLGRALNSTTDWPEYIVDAYVMFEREEGSLEQLDQAMERCDAQMQRIEERKAAAAEKEARFEEKKKKQQKQHQAKSEKKFVSGGQLGEYQRHITAPTLPPQEPLRVKKDSEGFAVPALPSPTPPPPTKAAVKRPPPGYEEQKSSGDKGSAVSKDAPPGYRGPPPGYRGPPLGYLERQQNDDAPPEKKQKVEEAGSSGTDDGQKEAQDADKNTRTVFISNLDFNKKEADLLDLLERAGKVKDIRLVKAAKGRTKGFGYVEYEDEFAASEALKLDRTQIDGRAMYVSRCVDRKQDRHQFKYETELEKKKLFVRGLPFSTNKEALQTLFSQYGAVKEVRMVTYKSGAPKGIAYVEYEKEEDAAKAVLKTDGITMGEHQISVAISNPPKRRPPLEQRLTEKTAFTPTLGGGKKDVNRIEKPRTMLAFQPRSLKSKVPGKGPAKANKVTSQEPHQTAPTVEAKEETTSESKPGLSNAQFRDMLLKKNSAETSSNDSKDD